jgi:hypothetical protein
VPFAWKLKAAGLASVNPSHPDLLVLIEKGADIGLFVAVAQECVAKQKTFPYALATVKGRMADAAVLSDSALAAPHKHAGLGNKQEALEQRNRQVAQAWAAGDDAGMHLKNPSLPNSSPTYWATTARTPAASR